MIKIISTSVLILSLFIGEGVNAQLLYNNNANIFVSTGGVLHVNGTTQNANGTVENNGTTNITVDYINDDITQGTGDYYVTGNWENNSVFTQQTSHVYLNGANQQITGTSITSFYDLSTIGSGIKTQTINSRVLNVLDLTDRELATDAFTMFIDNNNVNAITFTSGFVSSDPTAGRLDRATNSTGAYIFPTGSSVGTLRYRPVEITPTSTSASRYEVRFANVLATTEGYNIAQTDTAICSVNPTWFHIIDRSLGTADGDVTIYYDQLTDGTWSGMAQWNSGPTEWQNMGTVVPGIPPPLESLTKLAWTDWADNPYALTVPNPIFDVAGVDATTCDLNDGQLNFTSLDANTTYTVTYDSSGVSVGPISITTNGSGQATINTGGGTYTNITVDDGTCNHVSSVTIVITEPPLPTPTITGTLSYCAGSNATLDAGSFSSYSWSTGGTGQTINATIADNPITVTVTDANGCDGTSPAVNVIENPNPDPGTNGALTICPTDPSTDLFNELNGTPDGGGTWSPVMTSGTGVFDPGADPAGTYTYSVTNGCGTLTADVVVTITASPDPGTNGALAICLSDPSTDLFNNLNGTPDGGGTWTPALTSGTGVFDPSQDAAGTYTYTLNDCGGGTVTADVVVTINPAPVSGTNGTISFCSSDAASDLFSELGGSPDAGGTWSPVLTSGTGVFDPSVDGAGTYTYTVTNSCGSSASTVDVTISPCNSPVAGFTISNNPICIGDCIVLTDTSTNTPTSWDWNFGGAVSPNTTSDQNPTICPDSIGTFTIELIVSNADGTDTVTQSLVVNEVPSISVSADTTLSLTEEVDLTALGTPVGGAYSWNDASLSCPTCPTISVTPTETTTYTVTYISTDGCSVSDSVEVAIGLDDAIGVPNGFSPNADGNNDVLYVKGNGIETMTFIIYNRYGQKVFEANDQTNGWDGTLNGKNENPGVFVWYLEYVLTDGTSDVLKGNVTLLK